MTAGRARFARAGERWWLSWVAMIDILLGRKRPALQAYERILGLRPRGTTALTTVGNLRAELGDVEGAIAAFRGLTTMHPKHPEGWFNLGYLLEKKGELDEAETCFRRAVDLKPSLDVAWYGLGLALIRQRRLDEAVAPLKRNTELQPFSPYGWFQLAMTYHHLGRSAEARRIYESLRKFEPRYAATLLRDMETTTPASPRSAACP